MLIGTSYRDLKKNESFYKPHLLNRTKVWTGKKHVSEAGSHPLSAQALKHHLHSGSFSLLTAHNPGAKKLSEAENKHRNEQLESDLKRHGAIYHKAIGQYGGHSEESFMVHHTTKVHPEHLSQLAHKYGQEAILHSSQGHHKLEYVKGENVGKHHPGKGHKMKAKKDFTQVESTPKSKFSLQVEPVAKSARSNKKHVGKFTIPTTDGHHEVEFHIDHEKLKDNE